MDMTTRLKVLGVLDKPQNYKIPESIQEELTSHFRHYPKDDKFQVEVTPGTYGVVTCMEDNCYEDFVLGPKPSILEGGKIDGFGSMINYQEHCTAAKHVAARSARLGEAGRAGLDIKPEPAAMILSDDEDVKPFRGGSGIKREPDIDLTAYRGRPGSFYEEKPDIKRMKLDPEVEIMDVKPNAALLAAMRDRELLVAAQQARYEQQRQAVIRNAALMVEQRQVIQARWEEQGDDYKAVVDAEGAVDDDAYMNRLAHNADLDEFIKNAADGHEFEGNATVEEARAKLKLQSIHDKIPGMKIKLMPHQFISVAWMVEQEKSKNFGGILADEMGLGKTVSAIGIMTAQPSKDKREKTNLIVAPLALLQQWKDEIESKCERNHFQVLIHHGSTKAKSSKELMRYDVVLTTYQTLSGEWADEEGAMKKENAKRKKLGQAPTDSDFSVNTTGPLFESSWYRVILDEAQFIRNRSTRASRAVSRIDALMRWCLTGTPVTNSLSDLYGLFRFIHIKPWFEWGEFSRHIMVLEKKRPDIAGRKAQAILKTCLLRRKKDTKLDGNPLITLPEKHVEIQELEFSPEEREIYTFVQTKSQATFNRYLKAGTVLKNYAHVLVMLLRLRQIACHPALISEGYDALATGELDEESLAKEIEKAIELVGKPFVKKLKAERLQRAADRFNLEQSDKNAIMQEDECGICLEPLGSSEGGAVTTACAHIYCRGCIIPVLGLEQGEQDGAEDAIRYQPDERPCPGCRQAISMKKIFTLEAFEPTDEELSEVTGVKIAPIEDEEDDDLPIPVAMMKGKKKGVIEDSEDEEEKKEMKEEEIMSEKKAGKQKEKKVRVVDHWMVKVEPSAKMRWLLAEIQRVAIEFPDDKFLVLCSFTKMLDILDDYLTLNGVKSTRYQGDMSRTDRDKSIRVLQKSSKVKVILMSLKCGGVGLNLVRANHVVNLDLAWSHAVEAQAFDRCHRIGQEKEVFVNRLTVRDSVDQRIAEMQDRKRMLSEASLGEGSAAKIGKMSIRDLAGLFGLLPNGKPLPPAQAQLQAMDSDDE